MAGYRVADGRVGVLMGDRREGSHASGRRTDSEPGPVVTGSTVQGIGLRMDLAEMPIWTHPERRRS